MTTSENDDNTAALRNLLDRALAETRMVLQLRAAVHGVPVDVTC